MAKMDRCAVRLRQLGISASSFWFQWDAVGPEKRRERERERERFGATFLKMTHADLNMFLFFCESRNLAHYDGNLIDDHEVIRHLHTIS